MASSVHTPRPAREYPRRVIVRDVLSSRYGAGNRPLSWDQRRTGIETITTTDGDELALLSEGGQSSPAAGWELLVIRPAEPEDFRRLAGTADAEADRIPAKAALWTLYGIAKAA